MKIDINLKEYTLKQHELDNFASEYYGRLVETVAVDNTANTPSQSGDTVSIIFDPDHSTDFLKMLNLTFKKQNNS